MKHLWILLALLLPACGLFTGGKADALFEEGVKAYNARNFTEAIRLFRTVVEEYGGSGQADEALYNLAFTYSDAGELDSAVAWYDRIVASPGMRDDIRTHSKGFHETHTNFHHASCLNAGNIEYNRKNYRKALQYYQDARTRFPYYNDYPIDLRIRRNTLSVYIADCFIGMEESENALTTLLPDVLDSWGSKLYPDLVAQTMELIDGHFERKRIAGELEASFASITPRGDNDFDFTFRGKKLELTPFGPGDVADRLDFTFIIKHSSFWEKLTS
jgi:tetratricopeptide (TPR) repeat protein